MLDDSAFLDNALTLHTTLQKFASANSALARFCYHTSNVLAGALLVALLLFTVVIAGFSDSLHSQTGAYKEWATFLTSHPEAVIVSFGIAFFLTTWLHLRAAAIAFASHVFFRSSEAFCLWVFDRIPTELEGEAREEMVDELMRPRFERVLKEFTTTGNYTQALLQEEFPSGILADREQVGQLKDVTSPTRCGIGTGMLLLFTIYFAWGTIHQILPAIPFLISLL